MVSSRIASLSTVFCLLVIWVSYVLTEKMESYEVDNSIEALANDLKTFDEEIISDIKLINETENGIVSLDDISQRCGIIVVVEREVEVDTDVERRRRLRRGGFLRRLLRPNTMNRKRQNSKIVRAVRSVLEESNSTDTTNHSTNSLPPPRHSIKIIEAKNLNASMAANTSDIMYVIEPLLRIGRRYPPKGKKSQKRPIKKREIETDTIEKVTPAALPTTASSNVLSNATNKMEMDTSSNTTTQKTDMKNTSLSTTLPPGVIYYDEYDNYSDFDSDYYDNELEDELDDLYNEEYEVMEEYNDFVSCIVDAILLENNFDTFFNSTSDHNCTDYEYENETLLEQNVKNIFDHSHLKDLYDALKKLE